MNSTFYVKFSVGCHSEILIPLILLWMLLKQGTGKKRGEGEIDKWEASRELEMKLLIELGLR